MKTMERSTRSMCFFCDPCNLEILILFWTMDRSTRFFCFFFFFFLSIQLIWNSTWYRNIIAPNVHFNCSLNESTYSKYNDLVYQLMGTFILLLTKWMYPSKTQWPGPPERYLFSNLFRLVQTMNRSTRFIWFLYPNTFILAFLNNGPVHQIHLFVFGIPTFSSDKT